MTKADQDLAEGHPGVTGMTGVTVRGIEIAYTAPKGANMIEIVSIDPREVQKKAKSITGIENELIKLSV